MVADSWVENWRSNRYAGLETSKWRKSCTHSALSPHVIELVLGFGGVYEAHFGSALGFVRAFVAHLLKLLVSGEVSHQ